LLIALTVAYYVVPLDLLVSDRPAFAIACFAVGFVAVAALLVQQIVVQRRAATGVPARMELLLAALYLAIVFFAGTYYVLARWDASQVVGLRTRTDALYFALTIATTTGFGDIHAQGQVARVVASVQLVFDVAFIGAVAATLRASVAARRAAAGPEQGAAD